MNQKLQQLEDTITSFQEHRRKAAKALWKISSESLYEARGYDDVKSYAAGRFSFTRRRAGQLIQFGRVVDLLDDPPKREAHARPLSSLDDDEVEAVWELVTDRHRDITMQRVREAKYDYESSESGSDTDSDSSPSVGVNLALPVSAADSLGLSGDVRRGRKVVSADRFTRSDLDEIIEETEPKTASLDGGADGELGSTVWRPLRGADSSKRLREERPSSLQFHPDKVQRIRKSHVPQDNNSDDFRATEGSDALACPEVDVLSNTVPDPLTKEILEWGGGGDWNPIFLSSHPGRWTDHTLPSEGWIGARSDRSSIEETTEALDSADDSEVKWTLYDLAGEDRREGLPDIDLSVLDWLVIDKIRTDLPIDQIRRVRASLPEDTELAVRGDCTTSLKDKPTA